MPRPRRLAALVGSACLASALQPAVATPLTYPGTPKGDVVQDFHGTQVADPYRWLEDAQGSDTQAWITAQNKLTRSYIDESPVRRQLHKRLTEVWNYPRIATPVRRGEYLYFSKNDGLQNQAPLYRQKGMTGKPQLVLDPNTLSSDGTVALKQTEFDKAGRYMAYGLSRSGSDGQDYRIRNLQTGKDLPETLHWCQFASIAWAADSRGFYYNRFPAAGSVPADDEHAHNRLYWHKLGTPQSADRLIMEKPEDKELMLSPGMSWDGRYLFVSLTRGTSPHNRLYVRREDGKSPWIPLIDKEEAEYAVIGSIGDTLYLKTNAGNPRGRIVQVDLRRPSAPVWKTIVPETADVIDSVTLVAGGLAVTYMRDAHSLMRIYDRDGRLKRDVSLPTLGTVTAVSGEPDQRSLYFGFTSFLFPTQQYRYDAQTGALAVFAATKASIDTTQYVTEQVFVPSKDGTKVPVFLVHRQDIPLDGTHPTLLYGYGGFNVSLTPSYSASRLVWLEHGGIYALANLRGGGEYGEAWHEAGMLTQKQHVFDDFQATAAWLIKRGYTQAKRLAIMGGSNGGLLVAASMVQRPDLFGAVICQVPVTDMLRYHRFTVGRYWVPEYGSADADQTTFQFLRDYSPLHNVKAGVAYPPTLITTADTDDRVVPAHAYKFAATLQAANPAAAPMLLRVETKAGHGAGKPTAKVIDEIADIDAFLFRIFGMQ
ncbi:MAG: S9 family peptidase [Candidatus Sericytochromatia bacterium]|nr:S9 family peptidase [Candidatus Sericytochromatia bacterium]